MVWNFLPFKVLPYYSKHSEKFSLLNFVIFISSVNIVYCLSLPWDILRELRRHSQNLIVGKGVILMWFKVKAL